jgi:hypothetical protein
MNGLSERCNIVPYISINCKVPDHSVLHVDFNVKAVVDILGQNEQNRNVSETNAQEGNIFRHRRYRFEHTPDFFMASDIWKSAMNVLIDMSISCKEEQNEIDNLYETFCNTVTNEMDMYLKYTDAPRNIRKKLKISKPYWNDELFNIWLMYVCMYVSLFGISVQSMV